MQKRKPIIDNPVYSEIIIKINTEKVYAADFIKEFKNKERSVLARQLKILSGDDYRYLIKETIKEVRNKKEIKFKGNLIYYSINWKKILLDFYKVLVVFANEMKYGDNIKEFKNKKIHRYYLKEFNTFKSETFKHQLINSLILQDYISFFLKELNNNYETDTRLRNITLRNIFLEIFERGLYASFADFVSVIEMENITKPNLFYGKENLEKKKKWDREKIKKYLNEIKFICDYCKILEDIGFGSSFYEGVSSIASEKIEKKYLNK